MPAVEQLHYSKLCPQDLVFFHALEPLMPFACAPSTHPPSAKTINICSTKRHMTKAMREKSRSQRNTCTHVFMVNEHPQHMIFSRLHVQCIHHSRTSFSTTRSSSTHTHNWIRSSNCSMAVHELSFSYWLICNWFNIIQHSSQETHLLCSFSVIVKLWHFSFCALLVFCQHEIQRERKRAIIHWFNIFLLLIRVIFFVYCLPRIW